MSKTVYRNSVAVKGGLSAQNSPDYFSIKSPRQSTKTATVPSQYSKQAQSGALAQNGKMYFVALHASSGYAITEVTPGKDGPSFREISLPVGFDGQACIAAPNGLIYCFPFSDTFIMSYNPETDEILTNVETGMSGTGKYTSAVLHPNGLIYLIPYNATHVGIFDPSDESLDTTSITAPAGAKFSGAALAENGKIYCTPYSVDYVGIIDVVAEDLDTTTITVNTGSAKYYGGSLAHNGKIYCCPRDATTVLIIDPSNNSKNETSITGLTGADKFGDTVVAPDGKVYCCPISEDHVLIIDPDTDSADPDTLDGVSSTQYKYYFCLLHVDGKIYCPPYFGYSEMLIIEPGVSKYPLEPLLVPHLSG